MEAFRKVLCLSTATFFVLLFGLQNVLGVSEDEAFCPIPCVCIEKKVDCENLGLE